MMPNELPVDNHVDLEEDDSKERFDVVFSPCDCENCEGFYVDVAIVPEHGCYGDEDVCGRLCPVPVQEQFQVQCECECHQKPEINQEYASWDKPNDKDSKRST